MPGKAATFAICFTPGRNPPIPWEEMRYIQSY